MVTTPRVVGYQPRTTPAERRGFYDLIRRIAAIENALARGDLTQYPYRYSNQTSMAGDPGHGYVRFNNLDSTLVTQLSMSLYDRDDVVRPALTQLAQGDEIAYYEADDISASVKFRFDAAPNVIGGQYLTASVIFVGAGTAAFAPANNSFIQATIRTGGSAGDALTQAEADARYVNVAGDAMTGALTLPADPTAALQAATKQYVDAAGSAALAAWPIGSVFISASSTNPATLLGGGTWVAIDPGAALAVDSPATMTIYYWQRTA